MRHASLRPSQRSLPSGLPLLHQGALLLLHYTEGDETPSRTTAWLALGYYGSAFQAALCTHAIFGSPVQDEVRVIRVH